MTDWNRISKLIGMLGSDADGERLNAARLLAAKLKADGASFGDLANRVGSGDKGFSRQEYIPPIVRTVIIEKRFKPNPAAALAAELVDKREEKLSIDDLYFIHEILRKNDFTAGSFDLTAAQADRLASIENRVNSNAPILPKIKAKRGKTIPKSMLDDMGLGAPPTRSDSDDPPF